jgi:hypothetical protein
MGRNEIEGISGLKGFGFEWFEEFQGFRIEGIDEIEGGYNIGRIENG